MAVELVFNHFPELSDHQRNQMAQLGELYRFWNERINVISRQDVDNLYERHVLHSLALAKLITFQPGTTVLDVGTGGGFPGIPLAILFPETSFHLIDSTGKKITVVQEVASALSLSNVHAQQIRAEEIQEAYDFVVSRAVTRLKPFSQWVRGKFNRNSFHSFRNGIFYLKGGDLTEELVELARPYRVFDVATFFPEPFFETKKVVYVPMV